MPENTPFYSYPNSIPRQWLAKELPNNTVALILAGGKGTRLKALTQKQPKPSLHFGGNFELLILLYPIVLIQVFIEWVSSHNTIPIL